MAQREGVEAGGAGLWHVGEFFSMAPAAARPGLAAAGSLAVMESWRFGTVAISSTTFTKGTIARLSIGDRIAASQLAAALLGLSRGFLLIERATRGRRASERSASQGGCAHVEGHAPWGAMARWRAPSTGGFAEGILLDLCLSGGDFRGTTLQRLVLNSCRPPPDAVAPWCV